MHFNFLVVPDTAYPFLFYRTLSTKGAFSVSLFMQACQLNLSNGNILSQDLSYQVHLNS